MENEIKVSIIASAVRPRFYPEFLKSLISTSVTYEVVFVGHNTREELFRVFSDEEYMQGEDEGNGRQIETRLPDLNFKYIHTGTIKPAQCYEIARRHAIGETIAWSADDAEHTPDLYGKAYRFWKSLEQPSYYIHPCTDEESDDYFEGSVLYTPMNKNILTIQSVENGMFCDMKKHSFFPDTPTPIMAPIGLMSRQFLQDIGGFDRRYICGQYENDAVMRAIQDGAEVKIFGDKENHISLDHFRKHGLFRPFVTGYNHDREILEESWTDGKGKVFSQIQRLFEPYQDEEILTKSQSYKGQWK